MPPDHDGCLFCEIAAGHHPAFVVWQDERHLAFLTPFPNTRGFTVVATRAHQPSYLFDLDDVAYVALCQAGRRVGHLLDRALGSRRTGLMMEGCGVDHAHLKLAPLHGIPAGPWQPIHSTVRTVFTSYQGYLSSHDGPRVPDASLAELCATIRAAATHDETED